MKSVEKAASVARAAALTEIGSFLLAMAVIVGWSALTGVARRIVHGSRTEIALGPCEMLI
jgi:hypothetical protein